MKKILLTAVAVFAFSFANAQETKFGLKAGLNVSNLGGDIEDTNSKIGFQVGGFAEIKLSEKFFIQPELLYSTQGSKTEMTQEGEGFKSTVEYSQSLSYLNLPIMLKYYVIDKLSLEAGPQIGFLLGAEQKAKGTVTFDGETETAKETLDNKDFFESIDFGVNFGAGYDVTEKINIGVRYSLGLSNIVKDSGDDKVTNSNIALAIGYKF